MNSEFYKEKCPGCGGIIDSRDLHQLQSHFNFNMITGKYECFSEENKVNKSGNSYESPESLISEFKNSRANIEKQIFDAAAQY